MKKSKHHLIPKARKSELKHRYEREDFNHTLMLWRNRHDIWHILFRNQTLDETIEILKRIRKMKFK